mgnify:CR=1 FL=1
MSQQEFLQSIALVLISASFFLGFALTGNKLWTWELFAYSTYAVIPSFIGMYIGRKLQNKFDEKVFKKVFLSMLIIIGLLIINIFITNLIVYVYVICCGSSSLLLSLSLPLPLSLPLLLPLLLPLRRCKSKIHIIFLRQGVEKAVAPWLHDADKLQ